MVVIGVLLMQTAHVGFYNHRLVDKGTETVERGEMGWAHPTGGA